MQRKQRKQRKQQITNLAETTDYSGIVQRW